MKRQNISVSAERLFGYKGALAWITALLIGFTGRTVIWPYIDYDTVVELLIPGDGPLRIKTFAPLLQYIFIWFPPHVRPWLLLAMAVVCTLTIFAATVRLLIRAGVSENLSILGGIVMLSTSIRTIGWRCDDNFLQLAFMLIAMLAVTYPGAMAAFFAGLFSMIAVAIHVQVAAQYLLIGFYPFIVHQSWRERMRQLLTYHVGGGLVFAVVMLMIWRAVAGGALLFTGVDSAQYAGSAKLFLLRALGTGHWNFLSWTKEWFLYGVAAHSIWPDRTSVLGQSIAGLWSLACVVVLVFGVRAVLLRRMPPMALRIFVMSGVLFAAGAAFSYVYERMSYERWAPAVACAIFAIMISAHHAIPQTRAFRQLVAITSCVLLMSFYVERYVAGRDMEDIPTASEIVHFQHIPATRLIVMGSPYDWCVMSVFREQPMLYIVDWGDGTYEAMLFSRGGLREGFTKPSEVLKFLSLNQWDESSIFVHGSAAKAFRMSHAEFAP